MHIQTIKQIDKITHDVLRIVIEKPGGYTFTPGQATEVSINKNGWKDEKRPFTFTSLPTDDFLEFTIKTYPGHKGVTNEFLNLKAGDELIIRDTWGAINYQGEGLFIAGGAGITPFIAIFRMLRNERKVGDNKLIFANKTVADIIHEKEFRALLGNRFINVLSDESAVGYRHGFITESLLKEYADDQQFYICGPPPMMDAVQGYLADMGVKEAAVIVEI